MLPPSIVLDQLDCSRHPCVDRVVSRLESEDQDRFLVIVHAINAGLLVVDHAKIRRVEAGLSDGAYSLGRGKEIGKAENGATAKTRLILQPHPGFDDHTERPLRADDQTVWARARA